MQQAQPIVKWMGGKRRLVDRIIPFFPQHSCYVEPFAGGAALFFMKPAPAEVEVLNDINGDLVNLYRVVQNHLEEFVRQFKWALSSRQVFKWLQVLLPAAVCVRWQGRWADLRHCNNPAPWAQSAAA